MKKFVNVSVKYVLICKKMSLYARLGKPQYMKQKPHGSTDKRVAESRLVAKAMVTNKLNTQLIGTEFVCKLWLSFFFFQSQSLATHCPHVSSFDHDLRVSTYNKNHTQVFNVMIVKVVTTSKKKMCALAPERRRAAECVVPKRAPRDKRSEHRFESAEEAPFSLCWLLH